MLKMTGQNPLNDNLERRLAAIEAWKANQEEREREKQEKEKIQEKGQKRKKVVGALGTVAELLPPLAAGGAFYKFLGNPTRELGEMAGETYEGVRVAERIMQPDSRDAEVNYFVSRINSATGQKYLSTRNPGYLARLETAVKESLEAAERASGKAPTTNSNPVKSLKDAANWIMEKTSPGDNRENEIRNTQQYQVRYNRIGEIRLNAIDKARKLNSEIEVICYKMAVNEAKTGKVSPGALKSLEKMAGQYNDIMQIAEGARELSVEEINSGMENPGYQAIVQEARNYRIQASDFTAYGTSALVMGTLGAMVLGEIVARPIKKLAKGAYKAGAAVYGIASKLRKAAKNDKSK